MKPRTWSLILLSVIILMSTGTAFALMNNSYACWKPECVCDYCKVKFTCVKSWDEEYLEKNVGRICAWIPECQAKIIIRICNAYPCYTGYVNFTIKNEGCLDVHIDEVHVENPNPTAIELMLTPNLECIWIKPCQTIKGQLTVHILQTAQECHTYEFKIEIYYSCEEKEHPRTIGFWSHQFSVALCYPGNAQVDPDTLLRLLNQISADSPVYEFTGKRYQKFQQALDILTIGPKSSMKAKLKAHLLALWLNYKSSWTTGYTLNGMTAQQIIQGSENALIKNLTTEYQYWKNLCDQFNNLP